MAYGMVYSRRQLSARRLSANPG